jgi:hypothetical protein
LLSSGYLHKFCIAFKNVQKTRYCRKGFAFV